jgi:hypothetical protein
MNNLMLKLLFAKFYNYVIYNNYKIILYSIEAKKYINKIYY